MSDSPFFTARAIPGTWWRKRRQTFMEGNGIFQAGIKSFFNCNDIRQQVREPGKDFLMFMDLVARGIRIACAIITIAAAAKLAHAGAPANIETTIAEPPDKVKKDNRLNQ